MNARDLLAAEVALLAAETDYVAELIQRGILPEGARRQPTTRELRAGVRFAELDRIVNQAAALIGRTIGPVREAVLADLASTIAAQLEHGVTDPYAVLGAVTRLLPQDFEGLPAMLDTVVDDVTAQLVAVADQGAAEALGEAARQGVPERLIPDVSADTEEVRAAAAAHARRAADAHVTRILSVAADEAARAATLPGATADTVIAAVQTAAEGASVAGVEDLTRQAANVAHGIGRRDAQVALPEPEEVYASELLDRNTCGPCADVDGTDYASLEEGLADYPGAGGYYLCDGGSRCRGTLVIVWPQEAGATRVTPGA